jgi:hypothetical protein
VLAGVLALGLPALTAEGLQQRPGTRRRLLAVALVALGKLGLDEFRSAAAHDLSSPGMETPCCQALGSMVAGVDPFDCD